MKVLLIIVGYLLVACLVWIAQYIYAIKKYKKEEEEKYSGTHPMYFNDWDDFYIERIFISAFWIIMWIPYLLSKSMCLVKNYIDKKYKINQYEILKQ